MVLSHDSPTSAESEQPSRATLTEHSNFRFEQFDLEIIHRVVERWSRDNGLDVGHADSIWAARQAFYLYRDGMNETELLDRLHDSRRRRH